VWFVIETVDQLDTSGFHERSVLGGVNGQVAVSGGGQLKVPIQRSFF
jgi:hypothetical protein